MSQRSRCDASGLLVVDKPKGVTSHDVVAAVRSLLHIKRVGHAGTLDPMATGVLVVGFGHATRLLNAVVAHDKTYEATIRLGLSTTTDDAEGDFLPSSRRLCDDLLTVQRVQDVIDAHLSGTFDQVPSTYSAIKVEGRRAYDLARSGRHVELPSRPITVSSWDIRDMRRCVARIAEESRPCIDLDVVVGCSTGTYIRALARDLGELLGVGGYLTRLRRTRVGGFGIDGPGLVHAQTQERHYRDRAGKEVTRAKAVLDMDAETLLAHAIPMIEAVRLTMPTVPVDARQARDLRFGRRIDTSISENTAAYVAGTDDVVAILEAVERGEAKPIVVFPVEERAATVDAAAGDKAIL